MAHLWHAKTCGFCHRQFAILATTNEKLPQKRTFPKSRLEYVKIKKAALSGSRYKNFKIQSYASATTDTNDLFARPFLNNTVPGTSANKV